MNKQSMLKITSKHCILFDFDGLLVDTEKLHFDAYRQMLSTYGYEISWSFQEYCRAAHVESDGLKKLVFSRFPAMQELCWDRLRDEKQQMYLQRLQKGSISLMPGAEQLLKFLAENNINHGIVTNSPKNQVSMIAANISAIAHIPFWVTREDAPRPKPFPDLYRHAKKQHCANSQFFLGFEDTLKGAQALFAANIPAILICDQDHPQLVECDTSFISQRLDSLMNFFHHCK